MGAKIVAGLDSEQVVRLYPETADEMKAKMENDRLSDNKLVTISINDDHHTHLIIHAQADATKASVTHIAAHQHAIMIQRQIQQLQGQGQPQPGSQPTGNQTQPNMAGVGSAPAAAPPQAFSVKQ
jgi:pyruvate/2-oxoglutarate dehydrogenase complex dihydrolipoamide dehydrogenase (E3) component